MNLPRRLLMAACAILGLSLGPGACGGNDSAETITVFAASSLTDAFTQAGEAFSREHPGYEVAFSFASSAVLAAQINEGAPADVFASANRDQMETVVGAGNADAPHVFARNVLALAAPAGSDAVRTFDDIARPGTVLVVAGPAVPAGALFHQALEALVASGARDQAFADAVLANVVSEEANVRAVLAKVELGEADAGFIYSTDVAIAGDAVREVEIPEQGRLSNDYLVATTRGAGDGARLFVDFVQSTEGQQILASYGFRGPP